MFANNTGGDIMARASRRMGNANYSNDDIIFGIVMYGTLSFIVFCLLLAMVL